MSIKQKLSPDYPSNVEREPYFRWIKYLCCYNFPKWSITVLILTLVGLCTSILKKPVENIIPKDGNGFPWKLNLSYVELEKTIEANNRSSLSEMFCKKVFLKITLNSQKNFCVRVSILIKLQADVTLLKKKLCHRSFFANFAKFLKNTFLHRRELFL